MGLLIIFASLVLIFTGISMIIRSKYRWQREKIIQRNLVNNSDMWFSEGSQRLDIAVTVFFSVMLIIIGVLGLYRVLTL